jgi:lipopolysaccharide export system protein LptA
VSARSAIAAAALISWLAAAAGAQTLQGLAQNDQQKPVAIGADDGIEWQQNNHVYIARGHATATRGDDKVTADTLTAYYRPSGAPTAAAPEPEPRAKGSDPTNQGSTQIYRIDADGNVVFTAPGETMLGDHGIYNLDDATLVVTGKHLEIVTERQHITARDSLEWYDQRQLGVARGDAVAVENGRVVKADVLTAHVEKDKTGQSKISRIDAQGHVFVSSPGQVGRGDAGVYDLDTGIATLQGHVRLTRGDNELTGRYGVVDMNTNVSRLLPGPPGTKVAGEGRVEGLIVPRQKPENE